MPDFEHRAKKNLRRNAESVQDLASYLPPDMAETPIEDLPQAVIKRALWMRRRTERLSGSAEGGVTVPVPEELPDDDAVAPPPPNG